MPTVGPTGTSNKLDANANSLTRIRRNMQRLRKGALTTQASNNSLVLTSTGLAVNLSPSGAIVLTNIGLSASVDETSIIINGADELAVKLNPTGGIIDSTGGLSLNAVGTGSIITLASTGAFTHLPVGSVGQILTVSSTSSTDLAWVTPSSSGGGGGGSTNLFAANSTIVLSTSGSSTLISVGPSTYIPLAGTGSGPAVSGNIDMGTHGFLHVSALTDFGVQNSILVNARQLVDSTGFVAADWNPAIEILYTNRDGFASVGWGSRMLVDSHNTNSVDWDGRIMSDSMTVASLGWQNRVLHSGTGGTIWAWGSTYAAGFVLASPLSTSGIFGVRQLSTSDILGYSSSGGGGSTFFVLAGNSGISTSTSGTSTLVYNNEVFLPGTGISISTSGNSTLITNTSTGGGGGSTFFVEAGNSGISTSTVGTSTFVYNLSTGAGVYLPLAGGTMTSTIAWFAPSGSTQTYLNESTYTSMDSGFTGSGTWGLSFFANSPGVVNGGSFYKEPLNNGAHALYLWVYGTTTLLASTVFTGETASGWQYQPFSSPVSISATTLYMIGVGSSTGHNYQGAALPSGVNNFIYVSTNPNGYNGSIGSMPTNGAPNDYGIDVTFTPAAGIVIPATVIGDTSGNLNFNGESINLNTQVNLNSNAFNFDAASQIFGDGSGNLTLNGTSVAFNLPTSFQQLELLSFSLNTVGSPTIVKGAALGTGAVTAASILGSAVDNTGYIQLHTGVLPGTGLLATVTYADAYTTFSEVTLQAKNSPAALASGLYISTSATGFVVSTATALTSSTIYQWMYHTLGV